MHCRRFSIKSLQDFRTMNRRRIAMGIIAIGLTAVAGFYLARGPRPLLSQHTDSVTLVETAFPAKRGEGLLRDNPDHVVPIICDKDGGFTTTIPATLADGDSNLSHLPAAEQIRRRRLTSPVTPLRPQFAKQFTDNQVVQSGQHTITMRPRSGSSVSGAISDDGTLIYRNAFPGTDVLYRSAPAKNEEFLVVKKAPVGELSWSWDLNPGELKPHQTKLNAIEFRNDEGTALLRIDPPVGRDAQGKYISAQRDLTIELVASNDAGKSYQMKMSLKEPGKWGYPIVIDPSLSSCASINSLAGFRQYTATSMADGKVLAFGGIYRDADGSYISTKTTWKFDPNTQTWTDIGASTQNPSNQKVIYGQAVLLNDGRILTEADYYGYFGIFNPVTNQWSILSSGTPYGTSGTQNMVKLTDGRVMLGGSQYSDFYKTLLFDPLSDQWSNAGRFVQLRTGYQCVAALTNGKALICNGRDYSVERITCELWDPSLRTWSLGPNMPSVTEAQSAIGLPDGRALVANGSQYYILSADASHWDTYGPPGISNGTEYDPSITMVLHPSGLVVGQAGVFDSTNNQFHAYGFSNVNKQSPYLLPGNDRALWLDILGNGSVLNLKPVCTDFQLSTHWNQPIDLTLVSDAIGHSSTWTISTPTAGQLTGQAPNFHFVPPAQAGTVTFTYKCNDSTFGDSNTATVTIDITNSAPSTFNQTASTPQGITATGTLIGSDPDGDPITFSVVTSGSHGTFSFTDSQKGIFSYIPNSNVAVADQITFKVTDGAGAFATAQVTINTLARNQQPSMTPGPDLTAAESSVANLKSQWVQAVSCGPSYESDQQVAEYLVTVDQPQFFTLAPSISVDGTLQFTPSGNIDLPVDVTMTIRVRDNGGTDNGGIDLSNSVTAVIHLTPVTETFTVTNTLDAGSGSLRNCLSLAHRGDTITFDAVRFDAVNSSAATVINVLSSLPTLSHGGVTIDASDRRVTINGTAAGSSDGLIITSDANRIFGLTLVGFTGSGIALTDQAFSNQLGGSRTVGGGPNGQGLRIANNGTYGIRLSGTQVQKNAIVGCWIGVSAIGTTAEPNLAGMLIAGGAHHNTIGSLNKDFANRIAGNTQEGIAIADVGSDYNIIIGNAIGGGKDSTGKIWTLGNGASGVYLSQGTVGTRVGASGNGRDDQLAANYIMNNGRYGIEVRSAGAKKHTFRGNHIAGNALGGIGIFDGANSLIAPPIMTVNNGGSISGTASTDGFVEFFNDQGDQGAIFLGRATVTNGVWNSSVSKDVSQNLTATFTDNEGNTSEFVMLAPASTEGNAADNSSSRSCGLGTGIAFMGLFGFFLFHLRLRIVTRANRYH
jgi:Bacterial Ig domain/Galactose oxidase, central domain